MLRQGLSGCEKFFIGVKHENGNAVRYRVFPSRCHSWDCPECSRAKAAMYRKRMRPLFEKRQLYMYTFTYYHSRPPIEVWKDVAKSWNRFRTAATKKFGQFSYARILEHHHKSDYPHLHVIADINIPPGWFNRELISAGFGYQAKVVPITTDGAVLYVTKYLTKPWTSAECKAIRKTLKMRLISFGGSACLSSPKGSMWECLKRSLVCSDVLDAVMIDKDWTCGVNAEMTFIQEFDANGEYTFERKEGAIYEGN